MPKARVTRSAARLEEQDPPPPEGEDEPEGPEGFSTPRPGQLPGSGNGCGRNVPLRVGYEVKGAGLGPPIPGVHRVLSTTDRCWRGLLVDVTTLPAV